MGNKCWVEGHITWKQSLKILAKYLEQGQYLLAFIMAKVKLPGQEDIYVDDSWDSQPIIFVPFTNTIIFKMMNVSKCVKGKNLLW